MGIQQGTRDTPKNAFSQSSPSSSSEQSITSTPFGIRNGAPISRKLVKIPKDQQAIFSDPEGPWISALKNNSQQNTARVPPKVLEQIKYFHTSRTLPPPAQKPNVPLSSGPTASVSVSENTSNDQQEDESDSEPEVPVSSWAESPPRPPRRELQETPSPAPSIRSQIMTQDQSGIGRIISQSPPPQTRSSPQIQSSPPIVPATKRQTSPPTGVKRRLQLDAFPSSSAGVEDELEIAIPEALCEATPPINRRAARLTPASQAATSPPCGQGSMVPSTYKDIKSSDKVEEPVYKKRRMKAVNMSQSSQEVEQEDTSAEIDRQSVAPLPQTRQGALQTSSGSPLTSAPLVTDEQPKLGTAKVVKDTPSLSGTASLVHRADETSHPDPKPSGAHVRATLESGRKVQGNVSLTTLGVSTAPSEAHIQPSIEKRSKVNDDVSLATRGVSSEGGSLKFSKEEVQRQKAISYLNEAWKQHGLDWIPTAFQHLRSTLTVQSLRVLINVTHQASKNGIQLSELWSKPDGPLYKAASNLADGKLIFSEEVAEASLSLFEAEKSKAAKARGTASGEGRPAPAEGSSRPASRQGTVSQVAPVNPSPPTSPSAMQGVQPTASPQVLQDSRYQTFDAHHRPQGLVARPSFAQGPLEAFRYAYPSFSGSVGDFVKACFTIKDLRRKRLLPKWLYDDFIRAFVDGFVPYIQTLDDDEEPLSAYQWYVEYVDRPAYQGGVVTRENLYLVLKIYNSGFKSARESVLESGTPFPEVAQRRLSEQSAALNMSVGPDTPVAQKSNPTPKPHLETRASGGTPSKRALSAAHASPAEQLIPSKTNVSGHGGQQPVDEAHTHNAAPPAPNLPLANGDKGKQRATNNAASSPRNPPASAPAIQRHTNALQDDEDVTFLSSTPRPRTANPLKETIKKETNTNGTTTTTTTPLPQKAAPNPLLSEQQRVPSSSKPTKDAIIAETPPRKTAGPPKRTTQHPAVRRSLPASFSDGLRPPPASMPIKASVPLTTSPAASPAPSGTPKSSLTSFFQESRVKKPKQKTAVTEQERRKLAVAKMERMAREGRYKSPSSTMPPRS
ncbi:hypothetical protein BDP81DRAFT_461400 [Colletotrichum phormii]|uniref:Uncharacterized protein n=1 Tax=Colletotrichum phormii TaxID=359342 RepID=A0AAI9ZPZ6_9PEZI|nr:uncharacterized protein BDP81DRAFT_461400 [Colletotrichum phormii]KAK1636034.1 hypothetical protein BDP81DRAFT_461400 [Colletotrichum phormii]